MSIAAAENAGLGPCDLPLSEQWLAHTQLSQSSQSSQYSSSSATLSSQISGQNLGLGGLQALPIQHSPSLANQNIQQQSSHLQSQSKIMNAVASAVACPPAATKKLRRKPENKKSNLQPQSQINKCNNEKRRRELENEYIEQLGEFLQINKRDMTACKPDKAAILSEVVRTFRRLLEQGNRDLTTRCSKCPPDCTDSCTVHPVQQGEVSSTEPPLPEPSVNGHSPEKSAYFEAVQHYISNVGWALLEINSEGVIECATENVLDVLHYSRSELNGQSIYSYLHTGDHSKLSPILDKNTFSLGWDQDDGQTPKRTIRTKIRWLLRAPEGASETIEQKQQRQDKYKDLLIISAPVKDDTEESSSVLCLITLPEDEQTIETSMPQNPEQFTVKLDTNGKIIGFDATTLRNNFAGNLTKETERSFHDLCHFQDRQRVIDHLNNVVNGGSQTASYRLRLGGPDVYVHVKAYSRLFRSTTPNATDFIMAVHTILNDNEAALIENHGLGNTSLSMPSTSSHSVRLQQSLHHQSSSGNMGGPLMTSIMNGGNNNGGGNIAGSIPQSMSSVVSPRSNQTASSSLLCPQPSDSSNFFNPDSFDFEFPHSTFDMESVGVGWDSRPDSRTSVTPVSTPRPPSVSAYSPAAAPMCPSPLTSYHGGSAGQPSPSNNNNNNNNNNANNNNNNNNNINNNLNNNNNNTGNFGNNFPFPFDDKEKVQEQIQQLHQPPQQQHHDSKKLWNLLTNKRPHSNASSSSGLESEQEHQNTNRILKGLLNSEEEKDNNGNKLNASPLSQRLPHVRPLSGGVGWSRNENKNSGNNMLLQLLNDKSDDDDPDTKSRSGKSELLKQLQKVKEEPKEHNTNTLNNEDLIQRLCLQGNDYGNRKRSSNEPDEGGAAKKSDDRPSKLREKNKMLASLLANPSKAPSNVLGTHLINRIIPDISTSNVRALSVPSTTGSSQSMHNNNNSQTTNNNNLKQTIGHPMSGHQLRKTSMPPQSPQQQPTSSDIYLNQQMIQQHQQQQAASSARQHFVGAIQDAGIGSAGGGSFSIAATATSTQPQPEWDPELNEILNHVIDIAPESNFPETELNSILGIGSIETSATVAPSQSSHLDIQEKLAINAIQKSLMQFETGSAPIQYHNNSPPAYPVHNLNTGQQQQSQSAPTTPNQNFPPPPVYPHRGVQMSWQQQLKGDPKALAIAQKLHYQRHTDRMLQQQHQKERLLQQQQKQQMVVPVNATASADQLCLNQGMQNIESLLNNTVAPNVSLQRSTSVVPDSQLSPGFTQTLIQQQLSPNQRTQFSPQAYQPNPYSNNTGNRLSPQQQQQQQIVTNFQQNNNNSNQQLSPRQPPFNTSQNNQQNQTAMQQQQQWQQNANARLSIQQQNPMLNAQLSTVPGYNQTTTVGSRQFVTPQRQRSLNSPGTPVSRQNSFGGLPDGGFPGPPSPSQQQTSTTTYGGTVFSNQQMRLQRQSSVPPQATQHLPGSPRPSYGHGPGPDATGYSMMYNNMQHSAGSPGDYYNRAQTGANNGMNSSEFVRQELRAVVSGRTQGGAGGVGGNGGMRTPQSPIGMSPMSGGVVVGGNSGGSNGNSNNVTSNNSMVDALQSSQQLTPGTPILNTPPDLDPSMRFSFDIQPGATLVENKLSAPPQWSTGDNTTPITRISSEEIRVGDPKNSSLLLQKLLSD